MRNRRKSKKILYIIVILMMTLGFAYLSSTLYIEGIGGINANTWNVHWDNGSIDVTDGSVEASVPVLSESNTKVSFQADLELPGDFYEFTIDAVNEGTIDAMISSITTTVTQDGEEVSLPDYINFSVTYSNGVPLSIKHKLAKRVDASNPTKETLKVRLEYLESAKTLPDSDKTYTIDYEVKYQQADDTAKTKPMCTDISSDESIYNFDASTNTINGFKDGLDSIPAEITIPCSIDGVPVENIGSGAFFGKSITKLTLNNNLEKVGSAAFAYTSIKKVEIPDSVKSIESQAFYIYYTEEIIIGDGVTELKQGSFQGQENLKKLVIGDGVKTIGDGLFSSSINLEKLSLGKNVETIGSYTFNYCKSLTELTLPEKLTTLKDHAFYENTGLTKIYFPKSLKTIGAYAFSKLTLQDLTINAETIGPHAFDSNSNLKTVKFGEGVKTIDEGAFYFNNNLEKIELPSTVQTIGTSAFEHTNIKDIVIPANVETVKSNAFANMYGNLKKVTILGENTTLESSSLGGNGRLARIINKSGHAYDWGSVIGGSSSATYTFETGEYPLGYGNRIVILKK